MDICHIGHLPDGSPQKLLTWKTRRLSSNSAIKELLISPTKKSTNSAKSCKILLISLPELPVCGGGSFLLICWFLQQKTNQKLQIFFWFFCTSCQSEEEEASCINYHRIVILYTAPLFILFAILPNTHVCLYYARTQMYIYPKTLI